MWLIYDLIFLGFAFVYIPYLCLRRKWHNGFYMRMGFLPKDLVSALAGKKIIWVHAVSVGEVVAVSLLVNKLKVQYPGHQIVVSTVTPTGQKVACEKLKSADYFLYAPLDLSWIVRRYLAVIRPVLYVAAETEIWPNMFYWLSRLNIPIVLVNGRLSKKSFRRYHQVRLLLKPLLEKTTAFCMQTKEDAERIKALGAPSDKVQVLGNVKFDEVNQGRLFTALDLKFSENDLIWVAGSTHPGEEEIVFATYKRLKVDFPRLHLVIVPRHVERVGELVGLATKIGLSTVRFSALHSFKPQPSAVIVVDEMGVLRGLYNAASVVFVGKSLVGGGGQNIIEPAALAKPVLTGPLMQNFQAVFDVFLEEKAIIKVESPDELYEQLSDLISDAGRRTILGERARRVVEKYQGTTDKTLAVISSILHN